MTHTSSELLQLTANTIRGLAMDAIQKANSGHPGLPMGMADAAAVLWLDYLRYDPTAPDWRGRDRFVLSAGHGSMLLYSLLHLAGYPLSMEQLQQFRQLHSLTPGHPEFGLTEGVETTTGPLGQGFANGIGMALAARMTAARFACPQFESRVFGIVSDGDLMEGISSEAGSIAGHLGLSNLVYLYDDNHITIDGNTDLTFTEDVAGRFAALGWHIEHADGHDHDSVRAALEAAIARDDRPALVICRTHIAFGSPNKVDTAGAHGAPLGEEEVALTKQALGMPPDAFYVPDEVRAVFAQRTTEHRRRHQQWLDDVAEWRAAEPARAAEADAFFERRLPDDLLTQLLEAAGTKAAATRAISGKIIQKAAALVPSMVGGSADLDASCKTGIVDSATVARGQFGGRNIAFGIREHAMAAICNGMSLWGGALPMCSTFLTFSDYMRPSIRLAALMKLPTTFVYTHDSLLLGEDGPTHQAVEQVAALRLIPNLHVFRPADGVETAAAWQHALARRDGPVALALTRQSVPPLSRPSGFDAHDVLRGGYVIQDGGDPTAVLLATGAEVHLALEAAALLTAKSIRLRVVSVPCLELLLHQDADYRTRLMPPGLPVLAVEMGRPEIWCQLTGSLERVLGVSQFGTSAPAAAILAEFGFTPTAVAARIEAMLGAGAS